MPRIFLLLIFLSPFFCEAQKATNPVVRNKKAPVEINGFLIRQDKRNIGYYRLLTPYNNGKPTQVYQVFLPNGTQIATAFAYGKENHDWLVTILENPDNTFDVNSKAGNDVRDIALVLIKNGYL